MSSFIKKWTREAGMCLLGLVLIAACGPIKEVPVKTETIVEYRDSIITKLDTIKVEITKTEYIKDWTGMLDTLELSAEGGKIKSRAWVDTTKSILAGELMTEPRQVDAVVPHTLEYHQKDSVKIQEIPIEVPVETIKKVYPKWMILLSFLGVISSMILLFLGYLKMKNHMLK